MKQIKLTQGKVVLVDDEDFEYLNQWKWHLSTSGYAVKRDYQKYLNKSVTVRMHRVINNTPEGFITDHINRNKLDNRRANLRTVTKSQNGINRLKQINNTSGYKGIHWHKKAKKWMVELQVDSRKIYLGLYADINQAVQKRKEAEVKYHAI